MHTIKKVQRDTVNLIESSCGLEFLIKTNQKEMFIFYS